MFDPTILRRTLHATVWVGLLLLPTLLTAALLAATYDATISDLVPIWSDEIWYWHQASTFSEAGLRGGYYSVLETPASAPFAHFHAWGLASPALYGGIAALFGLPLYGITAINLALLTLALASFVALVRPTPLQTLGSGLLLATFAPFIIYSSSSLLPLVQQALAVAVAAGFVVLLRRRDATPRPARFALALLLLFAAWLRPTWSLLFVPYWLLLQPRWNLTRVLVSGGVGVLVFGLMTGFYAWTSAPYPNFRSRFLSALGDDPGTAFNLLLGNLTTNLLLLGEGNVLEVRLRLQILLVALLLLATLFYALWRHRRDKSQGNTWGESAVLLYILGVALALTILLYDVKEWRDYRVLSPLLLLSGLVLIASGRRWLVLALLATNLLILPEALNVYRIWTEWHVSEAKREEYYAWEAEMQKVMTYEPGVDPWCNTLLHSHSYLFGPTSVLLAVDAGIGLSSPLDQPTEPPFRSRYLLLDEGDIERFADDLNVRQLLVVPNGVLYENRAADCPVLE